jgi:RHS repeat-associated protein
VFARRRISVLCALSLVASLVWGMPPVAIAAAAGGGEVPIPASYLPTGARASAALPQAQVAVPVWPSAGAATLALSGGVASASGLDGVSVSGSGSPGGLQVLVTAPGTVSSLSQEDVEQRMLRGLPVPDAVSPESVTSVDVTVLDQATAAALGVRGVVLTVAPSAGSAAGASAVQVSVGYATFGNAFGGGFGDRLRLASLPACALTTPQVAACQLQTPLNGSVNDKPSATVSATVTLGSPTSAASASSTVDDGGSTGGGGMVLALSGGSSSEQGNWGATSLSQSGSWQAGGSAGGFGYSIPVPVPPAPGGLTPNVSFDYSSASIDGLTKSTSQQASWIGEGWNYEPGFVERSYRPCRFDGNPSDEGDLCYVSAAPVTISLGGRSTRLLRDDASGTWKAEDDSAGWKVEQLTGLANGAYGGEAFKVTTRDGTQYWFGSKDHAANGGVLSVEVFGNNPGEPCYSASGFWYSHCTQPYRWNLDKVVDVHGNFMEYHWGTFQGSYGGNNGANVWAYDVYGWLQEIVYGGNTVTGSAHTGRVAFGIDYRCFAGPTVCDDAPAANAQYWMDTPWDLYCYTGVSSCGNHTPAFFSIYRLISVKTYVGSPANWGNPIEDFETTQGFPSTGDYIPPAGDDSSPSLYMTDLWRWGYPFQYAFAGVRLDNRVDYGTDKPPMTHWRIGTLTTPSGEQISVTYNGDKAGSPNWNRDCLPWENLSLIVQDANSRRCFPQNQGGVLSWWHKYVVTDVQAHDLVGGAPDEKWHYTYLTSGSSDAALWKHDQNWHTPPTERTWSRWAGFPTVVTQHGAADGSGPQQVTNTLYFRGMEGDKTIAGGWGSRHVTIDDDWDHAITDSEALAGLERRTYIQDGPAVPPTNWTSVARHKHSITTTGSQNVPANPTLNASRVREWQTLGQEKLAGPAYRYTQTDTDFESTYGLPTSVHSYGDSAIGTDDTCATQWYNTPDTTKWLIGFAYQTVTTDCAGSPGAANVLAASRTYYDQSTTLGAMPIRGLASKTTAIKAATAYPPADADYLQQSRATHDSFGRVLNGFDALDRQTSTAYTPTNSGPTTAVAVTGPMGAGWTITTTLDARWGVPTQIVDVNNKATNAEYDILGRVTKVWKNNRPTNQTPDVAYTYNVRANLPSYVQSQTLGPDGQQISAYQLFDGLLRTRQTQTVSATGTGRAVSETIYNGLGMAAKESAYFTTGNPGDNSAALVSVADTAIDVQTRYSYDNLGRQTLIQPYTLGNPRGATYNTTFGYDGAKTFTVTPPAGGTATTTIKDVQGRTVELRQHQGGTPAGAYIATTYTYDRLGQLTSAKDPALNTWSYSYDLLGRKTQTVDPDAGTSTSTYDNAGQVLSTTDGRPQTLYYAYDNLGRKTTERITSASGQIQADWVYDSLYKGQLTSTTRYIGGVATYSSAVGSYDDAYRPLTTTDTIPAFGDGGTTLTYTVSNTYKADGALATKHLPLVGGLPDETLTYTYKSATGLADKITSNANGGTTYVDTTNYQHDGLLSDATFGAAAGNQLKVTATYEAPTRRLLTSAFSTKTSGIWANDKVKDTYGYDPAGNITSIAGTKDGGTADQEQCFTYDYLRRLTEAWTQPSGACTTPQRTGTDPYRRQWPATGGYDNLGNRLQQIDKDPAGDTAWNYAVGGTSTCPVTAVKPHQVRQITATGPKAGTPTRDFCYDTAGNTTSRTTATGATQSLNYDVENHLQTVTQGGSTIASYTYDSGGRRLIGTETVGANTTSTLYLADGTELAKINAANPLGRRYYGASAVRDAAGGGLKWLVSTTQGSNTFQIDPTTNTISLPRRFLPFGEPRTAQPAGWIGTHGYIDGTQDGATGLTHLGAREYDPTTGRFASVDPLLDLADPQQWNAYSYAGNTPITASDPSGLMTKVDGGGGGNIKKFITAHGIPVTINGYSNEVCMWGGECYKYNDLNFFADTYNPWAWVDGADTIANREQLLHGDGFLDGPANKLRTMHMACAEGNAAGGGTCTTAMEMHLENMADEATVGQFNSARWRQFLSEHPGLAEGAMAGGAALIGGMLRQFRGLGGGRGASGDSCSFNSFAPDTQVLLANGSTKRIRDIAVGESVTATDPTTGETRAQSVTALHINHDVALTDITVNDSAEQQYTIRTTWEHPFWSDTRHAWIAAAQLEYGERLRSVDGRVATVITIRNYVDERDMWNLTISEIHTYYVLAGTTPVLVHNTGPGCIADADGIQHAMNRHLKDGPEWDPKAGYFDVGTDFGALASRTSGQIGIRQANGNIKYVIDTGRVVGYDKGLPTTSYTVIRDGYSGDLITMFPGLG